MSANSIRTGCPRHRDVPVRNDYRPFEHNGALEFFRNARSQSPVFFNEEIGYWVVTKRKMIMSIMRDARRFSAANALQPVKDFPDELNHFLADQGFTIEPTQVNCDQPKHTRIRSAASRFLNPKNYESYEDRIRDIAREFVEGLHGKHQVDLVDAVTYEFPARVLFLLLGIPDSDARLIKEWGDNRLYLTWGKLPDSEMEQGAHALLRFWEYCKAIVADRKVSLRDDYASALLKIRNDDSSTLSENEIVCLVFGLLLAGHETTTNASGNLILELLRDGGVDWKRLADEPELIPNAVEEGLRYSSSVMAWRRVALEDVTLGDVEIPAGANLLLALASANRDEEQIEDGEKFDILRARAHASHISFGHGIHFCIGAPLARLELKILVEELTRSFPAMRLLPDQKIDWIETISFRGPKSLWVDLGERR